MVINNFARTPVTRLHFWLMKYADKGMCMMDLVTWKVSQVAAEFDVLVESGRTQEVWGTLFGVMDDDEEPDCLAEVDW